MASDREPGGLVPVLNVSMSWANQLIAIAASFIVTPVLLHALGDRVYGTWLLVNSFVLYLRTLDLGIGAGTMKYAAAELEKGDRPRLAAIFNSSVALFALSSLLALLVTGFLVLVLPRAYPEALTGEETVIFVLGLCSVIDLLFRPQTSSLRARSLFYITDSVEVVTFSIFKLGLILYLASSLSLWVLALLTLGETILRNLIVVGASLVKCDWTRRIRLGAVEKATLRLLALYGGATFLINIGELVRFQIDAAVIGYFLPEEKISIYSIGMRLVSIAYQALGVIGAVMIPRFSGLWERQDREGYLRLFDRANLATGLFSAYVLANIAILGRPFLVMWIGTSWVDEAFAVTLSFVPAYFIGLLTGPGAGLLAGAGKLRGMVVLTLVEAAFNFILSVALLHWFDIYGVCLGTAIPMVVFRGIVFPIVLRESTGIAVATYWRSNAKAIVAGLLYAALILPALLFRIETIPAFLLAGAATTAVFAVVAIIILPEARQRLLRFTRRP